MLKIIIKKKHIHKGSILILLCAVMFLLLCVYEKMVTNTCVKLVA